MTSNLLGEKQVVIGEDGNPEAAYIAYHDKDCITFQSMDNSDRSLSFRQDDPRPSSEEGTYRQRLAFAIRAARRGILDMPEYRRVFPQKPDMDIGSNSTCKGA